MLIQFEKTILKHIPLRIHTPEEENLCYAFQNNFFSMRILHVGIEDHFLMNFLLLASVSLRGLTSTQACFVYVVGLLLTSVR